MSKTTAKTPLFLAGWVALTACLNCAGWILSGLHQLNAIGYSAVFLVMAVWVVWWWRKGNGQNFQTLSFAKEKRRFRRVFPLMFLSVTSLAILGGIIYAPTNFDALTYRVPRILHWLAAERWYWVHTLFNRVNTRAVGFEWVAAPLMIFTKTDRLLFLINVISFLLMPGLFFSILSRLGVRRRVAWHWMWLLPTGYSFLLQAASIGNDFFGAFVALAAFDFALRARTSKSYVEAWLSVLAAGFLTGCKVSDLPLLLPWLIAFLPSLHLLKARLAPTAAVLVMSVVCSFVPMAVVNYYYCQDWTGFKAEGCPYNQKTYALHLEHNTLVLAAENLVPPVFPWARAWNANIVKLYSPERLALLDENFEPSQAHVSLEEIQMEEWTGLGMGVSLLLLVSVLATFKYSNSAAAQPRAPVDLTRWALLLSPFISLAVFMSKASLASAARLATPYYGFIIPLLLVGKAQERIVQTRWWRAGAVIVFLMALLLVVISPGRPLWPANYVLSRIHSSNPLIEKATRVYAVYAERWDCFAPVRPALPPDLKVLGYLGIDSPETSLWRPFGSRRLEHITTTDTAEDLRGRGIKYALISMFNYPQFFNISFDQWLAKINAEEVQHFSLDLRAGYPASDWELIRLKE